jgi:hypothetical protein
MPPLASDFRRQLENVVVQARDLAETAARAALKRWAVDTAQPFEHFSAAEKAFRKRLRARGQQAGDRRDERKDTQEIERLTEELAYEYWHRMLFARFLAENNLLMHPDGVAVTLAECEELAESEKAPDGFVLAARYASRMLPEIFRTDDVLLEVEFPINDRLPLEKRLASLPTQVFTADDSLGWVYQFWQSKKKDEVLKSGQKIDGRSLPAVTQIFTEHYMVEFLLHNTIGAWWCSQHGIMGPPGGAGVPEGKCPVRLDYLRWKDDGTPAAGSFEGWPKTLKEFTMLDPCCGSGHFLVTALSLLAPLRQRDDGLSAADAIDAVLRENLHGLELDPRCTQIAAFAVALTAWKYPGADGRSLGYRPLPRMNIACSGQGVVGAKDDWLRLANGDERFREGIARLYELFSRAPTLGSLIDPRSVDSDLFAIGYSTLKDTLDLALKTDGTDPDRLAIGVAAQGAALAAAILAREFALVTTNVPYLGSGKQANELRDYINDKFSDGKPDLATAFVLRCLGFCSSSGTIALVTPQNWLFLTTYTKLRKRLLSERRWDIVARLGSNAFQDMNWWAATTAMVVVSACRSVESWEISGIDVSGDKCQEVKAACLANRVPTRLQIMSQEVQRCNPDSRVVLESLNAGILLGEVGLCLYGMCSGDSPRFTIYSWEIPSISKPWVPLQDAVSKVTHHGGMEMLFNWDDGDGEYVHYVRERLGESGVHAWIRGTEAWGSKGICISRIGNLACSLYEGDCFDQNVMVLVPNDPDLLAGLWCFISSESFSKEVRKLDQKLSITPNTLKAVAYDHGIWSTVAANQYPQGLPPAKSSDLTQRSFDGSITPNNAPLQICIARLLGYEWPAQLQDRLSSHIDADGIVPIPAARGEPPASERLREILRGALSPVWSVSLENKLLTDAGAKSGRSLDDWLRDLFFEQHCKLFYNRPFIWHIWDGRKDGFACLVNYHKLDYKRLESLTYAYLQDWITAQAAAAKSGKTGADLRLSAAQALQDKLKLILAGEPPYDIFVRWKPLADQPIGWNPDLNDGVRLNIRPFMTAGILRKNPNIKWTKDRGNEPERPGDQYPWFWNGKSFTGERVNDIHLTNAEKQAARDQRKAKGDKP